MDKLQQIAELVKRRKAALDDCVRELRRADTSEDDDARAQALSDAGRFLARVQALTEKIDAVYAEQIRELEQMRSDAARQGADAIAAAQGAITRLASGGGAAET